MGLLQKNLSDVREKQSVPKGQYSLSITSVSTSASENTGRGMVTVCQSIDEFPEAKSLFTRIFVVTEDDNEIFVDTNDQLAAGFQRAYGIDEDSFMVVYEQAEAAQETKEKIKHTDWNGLTAEAILTTEENESTGDIDNKVSRYIIRKQR